jgi:hypothetical protein
MLDLINKRNLSCVISKNPFRAKITGTGKPHSFVPHSEQVSVMVFDVFLSFFNAFWMGNFSIKPSRSESVFLRGMII